MKVNNIYLAVASFMTAALLLTACSPDEHSLGGQDITSADLVQGVAFDINVDGQNNVTFSSKLGKNYACYWVQPNGRSQGHEVTTLLPFAGEYEVTMGVATRGGIVYGEPQKFTISTNNMGALENPLYTYLAGGVGKSKRWVPCDKAYGVGQCSGPVMYCDPDNVMNEAGGGDTNIGINHMVPNWDPGFQSWLIAEDSPYMDSYMEFSLDDVKGCTITEYRGDEGATYNGKWNLNVSDNAHPTLSFTDAFSMHNTGFDGVCDNYTTNIVITELSEYMLQLATMRTNSEGAWWIIWNFIAEDVKRGTVKIPSGEKEYIEATTPQLPEIEDMETKLFTTDINGVEFQGAEMTFKVNEDAAYDWLWWNGGTSGWESVCKGEYGKNWAPQWGDDALEKELTLTKKGAWSYGEESGSYSIDGMKIVFDQELTFFVVNGESRTIEVKGKEWQVMKVDAGSELVLGVAADKDTNGNVNSYLVANFTYKPVGGGQTGPVSVSFDASKLWVGLEAGKYFRCQLYNPWGDGNNAIDPSAVKLKKNQKINVTFKLSGFTFSQSAKMVLCCNRGEEQSWETACYDYGRAISVDKDGTYTVSWTNDTGSTVKWDDATSALTMTMQFADYATLPDEDYGSHCTVESITIE